MDINRFQRKILGWYKKNRRDLPWRNTKDPYKILVSEVMLQQTQISRVIPKYQEFLKTFPTLESLAKTSDKKLLKTWAGLGYWRRALNLKATAKTLAFLQTRRAPPAGGVKRKEKTEFEQQLSDPKFLETLPGIGPYTARAVACFAFGSKDVFLDTNIRRVYLHFFFPSTRFARSGQVPRKISDKEILKIAQRAVWKKNPREWHYALFDYGATVLKNNKANHRSKHYAKQSKFEGSFRSFRTKVVNFLLSQKQNKASQKTITSLLKESPYPKEKILASLLKDRLIKQSATHYSL